MFSYLLVSNPPPLPIKLKLGLQIGGRVLIKVHPDQSNFLANQKQGSVKKYVFIGLFKGSSRALEVVHYSRVRAVFWWMHWI
jgi:hypothetical protein